MKIDTIFLDNFQGWPKGSELKFKKGFNIILGDTDSGKSAVVEAINSTLTGDLPENFISWWAKEAEVNIQTNEHRFYRKRGKDVNEIGCDNSVQERVGLGIDPDYFTNLGTTSLSLSNDKKLSLVLLDQLSSLFFISEPAPTRAKIINSVCGIDQVDRLMLEMQRNITTTEAQKKQLEENKKTTLESLEKVKSNFEVLSLKVKEISVLKDSLAQIFTQLDSLEKKKEQLLASKQKMLDIQSKLVKYSNLSQVKDSSFTEVKNLLELVKKFNFMKSKSSTLSSSVREKETKLASFGALKEVENLQPLVDLLKSYSQKIDTKTKLKLSLDKVIAKQKEKEQELQSLVAETEKIRKEVKVCPFCGRAMEGKHDEHR